MASEENYFVKVENISKEFRRGTYAIRDISFILREVIVLEFWENPDQANPC